MEKLQLLLISAESNKNIKCIGRDGQKHAKICSLLIRERKLKTIVKYAFTAILLAKIFKLCHQVVPLLVGVEIGSIALENYLVISNVSS